MTWHILFPKTRIPLMLLFCLVVTCLVPGANVRHGFILFLNYFDWFDFDQCTKDWHQTQEKCTKKGTVMTSKENERI